MTASAPPIAPPVALSSRSVEARICVPFRAVRESTDTAIAVSSSECQETSA
jgi:hypothetical protein